ncbi:MAG: CDP-diacylglycerol--glycerol-3-phosphate 3-phosphatidyltransferase [Piccolia ochrophora]|nr:MAG: CDP-diacylglycerol--glycerol-3-phosphate 3-phosphatidyltransferase [Piccolia ochrophora]
MQASDIKILQTPSEFYEVLKSKIRNAQERIFLSTLYIGREEHELISTIQEALRAQPNLKVSILADFLRGTRDAPKATCAGLLSSLEEEFGSERVEVRMYHTPNLGLYSKRIIPSRINEGWGLQHIKLYGVDDEIILSGANLSNDYFTNRQDRYHVFSSKAMTDYFAKFHKALSTLSYVVHPYSFHIRKFQEMLELQDAQQQEQEREWEREEGEEQEDSEEDQAKRRKEREKKLHKVMETSEYDHSMDWPLTNKATSPLHDPEGYIVATTKRLAPLIRPPKKPLPPSPFADTIVYPLAQLTPLLDPDTSTEHPGLLSLLTALSSSSFSSSRWLFTAGYFNTHPTITRALLNTASAKGTVVTAAPEANGFYNSAGVSGLLPAAYTLLARRFLRRVDRARCRDQIELKEWRRGTVGEPGGWTYHAKGLWVTMPGEEQPSVTLVGSSNYTKRSYKLDLEMNALVVTKNADLKKRLADEQEWLQEHARTVTKKDLEGQERKVGWKVRAAMVIVSLLGGAL